MAERTFESTQIHLHTLQEKENVKPAVFRVEFSRHTASASFRATLGSCVTLAPSFQILEAQVMEGPARVTFAPSFNSPG